MATPENLNKIDEFVKNAVKDYQPPFDSSHWDEFEKTLGKKSRGTAFGNFKFSLNTVLAIVAVSAIAYTSWYFATSRKTETTTINNSSETVKQETTTKEEVKINPSVNTTTVEQNSTLQNTTTNTAITTTQPVKYNSVTSNNTVNTTTYTNQNTSSGGNNKIATNPPKGITPIYGDMIDPKSGITKKTKDDPALNEKALDKLLNNDLGLYTKNEKGEYTINKDSLQKIFDLIEQKSKDSTITKTPNEGNIPK